MERQCSRDVAGYFGDFGKNESGFFDPKRKKPSVQTNMKRKGSVLWSRHRRSQYLTKTTSPVGGKLGNTDISNSLTQLPINVQEVKRLAASRPNSLNLANESGWTALHFAAQMSDAKWTQSELIQTFLKKGANLYVANKNRETPFTIARKSQFVENGAFGTMCEAIRNYQTTAEGRIPLYLGCHGVATGVAYQIFSKVLISRSGCPYLLSAHPHGLRVIEIRNSRPVVISTHPEIMCSRFSTTVLKGSSDLKSEVIFGSDGSISVLSASTQVSDKSDISKLKQTFLSPLSSHTEDLVIENILKTSSDHNLRPILTPTSSPTATTTSEEANDEIHRVLGKTIKTMTPSINLNNISSKKIRKNLFPIPNLLATRSPSEEAIDVSASSWLVRNKKTSHHCNNIEGSDRSRLFEIKMKTRERYRIPVVEEYNSSSPAIELLDQKKSPEPDLIVNPPIIKVLTPPTLFLQSAEPPSCNSCCVISPDFWGSSVGFLSEDQFDDNRFRIQIYTMMNRKIFLDNAKHFHKPEWVMKHCRSNTKWVNGKPVSLANVGNGNFVCLSQSDEGIDRVIVFSHSLGNIFYPIQLTTPSGIPTGISSKLIKNNSTGVTIPMISVATTTSIEIHKLNITKQQLADYELGDEKYTSELSFHVLNSDNASPYTTALSSAKDHILIIRGGSYWYEVATLNYITENSEVICRTAGCRDDGELNCLNISVSLSDDGEWILRRNNDWYVSAVYSWRDMAGKFVGQNNVNLTFAPIQFASVNPMSMVIAAPTGILSLVFTDVQSSTEIWERQPLAMQNALELHNNLLRKLLLRFCGFEVKTEGDSFMISFTHTVDALNWCLASQVLLMIVDWPEPILEMFPAIKSEINIQSEYEDDDTDLLDSVTGLGGKSVFLIEDSHRMYRWRGLRVRMGIHTCRPLCREDPASQRMDYFGPPVNFAARVSGYGFGGQIVISPETYEELSLDPSPDEVRRQICDVVATSLGKIRLKGIRHEKVLYEVLPSTLAERSEEFAQIREQRAQADLISQPRSPMSFVSYPASPFGSCPLTPGIDNNFGPCVPECIENIDIDPSPEMVSNCGKCSFEFRESFARYCCVCGNRREYVIAEA